MAQIQEIVGDSVTRCHKKDRSNLHQYTLVIRANLKEKMIVDRYQELLCTNPELSKLSKKQKKKINQTNNSLKIFTMSTYPMAILEALV